MTKLNSIFTALIILLLTNGILAQSDNNKFCQEGEDFFKTLCYE
jgi:hypothetical protein